MRLGKVVAHRKPVDTSQAELARLMVGHDLRKIEAAETKFGKVVLEVKNLTVKGNNGLPAVKNTSLEIKEGMILGIAGVDGNGQTELTEAISGMRKIENGQVFMQGKEMSKTGPLSRYQLGMAHVPADRISTGSLPEMTVGENLFLQEFRYEPYCKKGFLNLSAMKKKADQLIKEYDVRTPNQNVFIRMLSGGNQQKVILAREMSRNPKLLIAVHPTRGVDAGAAEYIHQRMVEQKEKGAAILLVSTELEEVMELADVIAVMYEGEIVGFRTKGNYDKEDIGLLMAGARKDVLNVS